MNHLHKFNTLILIGSLLVYSCSNVPTEEVKQDKAIPVKVIPIEMSSIRQSITASGQFTTEDESTLSFKNGGIISKIFVEVGDKVSNGQLLALLDKTEINAATQQADIGYQKAQRDYDRALNLFNDSVATLEQLQNAKSALDIARQQLVGANYNRNTTEIRANKSGYVLNKYANEGQVVGSGTPILQINGAASGDWVLKVGVSDHQWSAIQIGNAAKISSDAFEQELDGKVIRKSEGIDPLSGTFLVTIKITNAGTQNIASGLFGKAKIEASQVSDVWSIPYESIMDGDRDDGYVFVTNDLKIAERKNIHISSLAHDYAIVDFGLDSVLYLITSGNAYLKEGSAIQVIEN